MSRALERCGASLFAYCWMTNHVHLAVRTAAVPLGAVMGIVASRYVRAKQRALTTTGHLFERRYRARLIDADGYLLALVRYIHFNPVRARMVAAPGDYRWSSHRAYLGAPCPDWLLTGPVLSRLGPSAEVALPCESCSAMGPWTLETIAAEVARAHEFTMDDLRSQLRRRDLVQAREEFARRALHEGVASLSQVARYPNRTPSTLSDLLHGRR